MKKICSRCICNEDIPGIRFDPNGVCNFCAEHDKLEIEYPTGQKGKKILDKLINKIKHDGKNKEFDCVVGVSGGCDSSYLLHLTKKFGLRPLAVHFDNTWNSNISTHNIQKILKKLDVELYTYVVNNKEYDDIYRSFLKSGVPDIDTPTDIGLTTVLYKAAQDSKVKYILNGHSFRTEGIAPLGWIYMDGKYIQNIQKNFGTYKIETFPNLWLSSWLKYLVINRIKRIRPLYYIDYQKEKVKHFLKKEYGWKWYGGHHMENRFTIFTINYYLYNKFKIDFRIIEYSALVRIGQMTREEALEKIKEPPEFDKEILQLVKKRLNFTDEEFDNIMKLPKKTYKDYETYRKTFRRWKYFFWLMYKTNLIPKSFYIKYTK